MDKSCQSYGNFRNDNHIAKCGTPGLYRSPNQLMHQVCKEYRWQMKQSLRLDLALRTEPIISAWCAVAEKVNA